MAWIVGTEKNDPILFGTIGDDVILGLGGNDRLMGGFGADGLFGGDGIDTADYSDSNDGIFVDLAQEGGRFGTAEGDTLVGIEQVVGSVYNDLLVGDGNANFLMGGGDFDHLLGGDGDDILYGDGDPDLLEGGAGADVLNGGSDRDMASYENSLVSVFVSLKTGEAVGGDADGDRLFGIEDLRGSDHDDHLIGDDGANYLDGSTGDDVLEGLGGDDDLMGFFGRDTLDGGAGNDRLHSAGGGDTMRGGIGDDDYYVSTTDAVIEARGEGRRDVVHAWTTYSLADGCEIEVMEAEVGYRPEPMDLVGNEFDQTIIGNDSQNTIVGRMGRDVMTGLGGGDVFVWSSTAETGLAATEADVITDFNRAQGDQIAVNPIDANESAAGDQAFTFVGVVDFTSKFFTGAGQIGYFTTATDTYILLNTRVGSGAVDYEEATIRLTGVHTPDASWFAL